MFDPQLATKDELIDHVYLLQDRLKEHERPETPAAIMRLCLAFKITKTHSRILFAIHGKSDAATNQYIGDILYADRVEPPDFDNSIKAHVCKLRQRLAPHGIKIETVWGFGYMISEGRAIIDGVLA